jgi:hypothetical protein
MNEHEYGALVEVYSITDKRRQLKKLDKTIEKGIAAWMQSFD